MELANIAIIVAVIAIVLMVLKPFLNQSQIRRISKKISKPW